MSLICIWKIFVIYADENMYIPEFEIECFDKVNVLDFVKKSRRSYS